MPRLLRARQVLIDARSAPLADGWVAVEGGRIAAVGGGPPPPADAVDDLGDAVLMPGLVPAHTHVTFGLFPAHGEGLDFVPWIRALVARERRLAPEAFRLSARLSCLELVASGVTGVAEAADEGLAALAALKESGLKALLFQEEFDPDPRAAAEVHARLAAKLDRLVEGAAGSRVRIGISPHAPYTVSVPLMERMVAEAKARAMGLSIHLAESEAESLYVEKGEGPIAAAHRARGLEPVARATSPYSLVRAVGALEAPGPVLLVHGVRLADAELADLAGRPGCRLVHCPRSNARLGVGRLRLEAVRAAGVPWLLGLDGTCSADRLDPFEEMRAGLYLARAASGAAAEPPAAALLEALWAGHRALGLGPGRLEAGAPADLVALRRAPRRGAPLAPGPAGVVLQAEPSDVVLTMVDGEVLYRDGRFGRVDAAALRAEAAAFVEALPA